MRHYKRRSNVKNFNGRTLVSKQYFVVVNPLHVPDFTQNCTRAKENIH